MLISYANSVKVQLNTRIKPEYEQIQFQHWMSFLAEKSINPHILLHALSLPPNNALPETPLRRLNLLARTRQFDAIGATAQAIKDISFPTLPNKLAKAKQESEARKQQLGVSRANDILKQLDQMSKAQDPNFDKIDQGQGDMFELANILFQQGQYQQSLNILIHLEKQDLKQELWLKSTWARLYCEVLLAKPTSAKTLEALKKKIDEIQADELSFHAKEKINTASLMKRLYAQKEEFLLLSLFVVFRTAGDEQIQRFVDYCTSEKSYFSILQLTCPQLLRYIAVGLILNKTLQNNRSFDLFKLVELINRKYVKYTDAFTQFVSLLEIDFDFESATSKIEECKNSIREDIFLSPYQDRIVEGLHFLYYKRVCKVYEAIELKEIASFTGLSSDEAQLWILGYIRSGDIDAKIDSIAELVVNNKGKHNPLEKYLDAIPTLGGLVSSLSRAITTQ